MEVDSIAISELFVQELKLNNEIVQTVSSYVKLRRRGRLYTGLCPFHSEKSPSFAVYENNQSFYCFGCGAGGDVITFIRRIENLEYVDAVKFLAQRAGMEIPEIDDHASRLRGRVFEINRAMARYYFDCLRGPLGKPGLDYLRERGLSSKTIGRFGLGYAPDSWNSARAFLQKKGFHEEEMLAAGIIAKSGRGSYDQFRNRVMFPIIDLRGNVVGFGGRILDKEAKGPKYLNSSDTPVFKKSRNLFAMNFAKASKRKGMLLCEGYMDVISVHQAGFDNAVATLGTALTAEQARMLSQYTDTVTLAYDSDGPGQAATQRASGLLGEVGVKVRILSISGAKDPDEYIKRFGAERFGLLIDGASNVTEFEVEKLKANYDLESADGKVGFLRDFIRLILKVPSPVERDVYVSRAAAELDIQKSAIETELEYQRKRMARKKKKDPAELRVFSEQRPPAADMEQRDMQRAKNVRCAMAEDKLLAILMKYPEYYRALSGKVTPEDFVTDRNKALAVELFGRLEKGQSVDLSLLGETLTVEQMGILSALQASVQDVAFTSEDFLSYADTLLSGKEQKTKAEIAGMTDDDLKAYIASLASKKHK